MGVVEVLLERHGRTYAEDAGIRLADKPAPLYQLVVLSTLLSARIRADVGTAAARELFDAGMTTADKMRKASWQQRVDALGRGAYRRYDERTATMLGEGAEFLLETYGGDVRRMRDGVRERLQEVKGIGPVGADIFAREAQALWPELAPVLDGKALDGAARVGLPEDEAKLAGMVGAKDLPRLAAALVRVALDKKAADGVVRAARD